MFIPFGYYQGTSVDSDAQAYITAVGATGADATAINTLVVTLKNDGIWDKLDAAYPAYGTSITTAKYNLVNPLDTDAAFRLVGSGVNSVTADDGLVTDGASNDHFDTKYNIADDMTFEDSHVALWETNTSAWSGDTIPYGAFNEGTGDGVFISPRIASAGLARVRSYVNAANETVNEGDGFWLGQNDGTTTRLYKNGVEDASVGDTNTGVTLSSFTVIIGALRTSVSGQNYGAPTHTKWFSLGQHLTATEVSDYYDAVNTFTAAIGR